MLSVMHLANLAGLFEACLNPAANPACLKKRPALQLLDSTITLSHRLTRNEGALKKQFK